MMWSIGYGGGGGARMLVAPGKLGFGVARRAGKLITRPILDWIQQDIPWLGIFREKCCDGVHVDANGAKIATNNTGLSAQWAIYVKIM